MAYEDHYVDCNRKSKDERIAHNMRYSSPKYILELFEEFRTYFAIKDEKCIVNKLDKVIKSMKDRT